MHIRLHYLLIFFLIVQSSINAQPKTISIGSYVPRVGQSVPEFRFSNLLNYKKRTAKSSEFRGKVLILDFWDSHCLSCIESWPELIKLQRKFGDRLQIVLVNPLEDENVVQRLFEVEKQRAKIDMTLPASVGENALQEMFPHTSVPHVIWIDQNGVLKGITSGWTINEKNIEGIISGTLESLPQKFDNRDLIWTKNNEPIFINNNGGLPKKVLWQSIFAKADPRLAFSVWLVSSEKTGSYVSVTNGSILDMYELAYGNQMNFQNMPGIDRLLKCKISLHVKDTTKYVAWVNNELIQENLFTYQLIPSRLLGYQELQNLMQEDLKRYIGLSAKWEKKKVKCLVLSAEDTALISYKSGDIKFVVARGLILNRVSVSYFIRGLESFTKYSESAYPIIDETHFSGLLGDIDEGLGFDVTNYDGLNKALEKYKMHFTLQEREVDILEISEPTNYKFLYMENPSVSNK